MINFFQFQAWLRYFFWHRIYNSSIRPFLFPWFNTNARPPLFLFIHPSIHLPGLPHSRVHQFNQNWNQTFFICHDKNLWPFLLCKVIRGRLLRCSKTRFYASIKLSLFYSSLFFFFRLFKYVFLYTIKFDDGCDAKWEFAFIDFFEISINFTTAVLSVI